MIQLKLLLKDLLESTKDQDLSEDQVAQIKAAQEKMMTSSQALFTKMYENMQGAGGAAGAGPDMSQFTGAGAGTTGAEDTSSAAGGDDIIDGDFKEI